MTRIFVLLALIILSLNAHAQDQGSLISVEGRATIRVAPDLFVLSYTVFAEAMTASEVRRIIEDRVSDSVAGLLEVGILEDAISSYELGIERDYYYEGDTRRYKGFSGYRNIEIEIKDLSKYSAVYKAITSIGNTIVDDVGPSVTEMGEYHSQAILQAAENAKHKAAVMAEALGVKVGKLNGIRETKVASVRGSFIDEISVMALKRASDPEVRIYEFHTGTIEVEAKLFVDFELVQ